MLVSHAGVDRGQAFRSQATSCPTSQRRRADSISVVSTPRANSPSSLATAVSSTSTPPRRHTPNSRTCRATSWSSSFPTSSTPKAARFIREMIPIGRHRVYTIGARCVRKEVGLLRGLMGVGVTERLGVVRSRRGDDQEWDLGDHVEQAGSSDESQLVVPVGHGESCVLRPRIDNAD